MSLPEMYPWLKALHIAAVATWVGGMLAAAILIAGFSTSRAVSEAAGRSAVVDAVRQWDRRVTSPAMLLVWGFGLVLALRGSWFPAPWLMLKLSFAVVLSALHGILSGMLRRLGRADGSRAPSVLSYGPAAIVLCVFLIVILVVIKPF